MNVRDYALRRTLLFVPAMLFITVITFVLMRMAGSPLAIYATRFSSEETIQRITEVYHLNDPVWVQYFYWLAGVLRGDLGYSSSAGEPVLEAMISRAPASIELAVVSLALAWIISVLLGTLAGKYSGKWIDHVSRVFAVGGTSTPMFWAGLLLIFIGYVTFGVFPLGRYDSAIWESMAHPTNFYLIDSVLALSLRGILDAIWHLTLPAIVIAYSSSALITRELRSEIVEKKKDEYVNAARSRGIGEDVVFSKHVRRNAMIPTLTVLGLTFINLLRGIIVVELVFGWPGLGRWTARAATSGDYASIMGFVLLVGVLTLTVNLVIDIMYAYMDPRIELDE